MRLRLLAVLVALAFHLWAQEPAQKKPCAVSGRVVRAADNRPIVKAKLELREQAPESEDKAQETTSDENGAFRFDGSWNCFAVAAIFCASADSAQSQNFFALSRLRAPLTIDIEPIT